MSSIDFSIKDIEKVINLDGNVKNVEISRLTAPGENFISLVLRADFEVEENGQSKTVSAVAKCLPMKTKMDLHSSAMKKEIDWYCEVLPLLEDFAKENEIEMDFYPTHYGSRYSLDSSKGKVDSDSVLILGNLIPQGYQMVDRYVGFDFITSKAILKRLALFHAIPIAIKLKRPDLFEILKDHLQHTISKPPGKNNPPSSDKESKPSSPPVSNVLPLIFEKLVNIPDFVPYISKVKPLLDKPTELFNLNKNTKEQWKTVVHHNLRINNIMVNYRNGKEPLVKFVDFQTYSYGTYAIDLLYLLLSSVRNDVVRENMDDLLRFYYDEFTSALQKARVDLELTYGEFLEELRANAELALRQAFIFSTVIFAEKDGAVDVAVEGFDMEKHFTDLIEKMSQLQKDKLVLITAEAVKRNWI